MPVKDDAVEYNIIDITNCDQDLYEQLGTKAKFWFYSGNEKQLFKSIVTEDKDGNEHCRCGEDWSEKISYEIAHFLNIPTARYELAVNDEEVGVVSYYMVPDKCELIHGNQLLLEIGSISDDNKVRIDRKTHTINNVHQVLGSIGCRKPIGHNSFEGVKSPFDFFVGYLMLDVLVGNQDRHEENWAVVRTEEGNYHLAPSFDHAASMGRNESDENRRSRLGSEDVGQQICTYVRRAKSQFFGKNGKRLKTIEAFECVLNVSPVAAGSWLEKLKNLTDSVIEELVRQVPSSRMSPTAKEFTIEFLKCNRNRLLELKEDL